MPNEQPPILATERVAVTSLRPHPQNYRDHPADQREHLVRSIQEHGLYRNVVIARDGTILAGHGVVEAATAAGLAELPVVRLPLDANDPKALKLLAADNEIAHLATVDDRALTELLREIRTTDDLLGTGYDDAMLTNLLYVTRPRAEIGDRNDAMAWVGLPDYDPENEAKIAVVVTFDNEDDRERFLTFIGVSGGQIYKRTHGVVSTRWPPRDREDLASVRFTDATA